MSNIGKELTTLGHDVAIITNSHSLKASRDEDPNGIPVYRIPLFLPRIVTAAGRKKMLVSLYRLLLSPVVGFKAFLELNRLIRRIDPDILNLHYVGENAPFCLLAAGLNNFKLVINLHGNDIDRHHERSPFTRFMTRRTLQAADMVLSNSNDILDKAISIEPGIRSKSAVVGNGIYLEEFGAVEKYQHSRKYIFSAANFAFKKGHDILIEAFKEVHQRFPDIDLLLAGDGVERKKCESLAGKLGLTDSIIFLGNVERSVMPSLFAGCELFVLPSRKEPFGIAVLEAMAAKKPVIASEVGGIPDIITHMHDGILVPSESPADLAQQITFLLTNGEIASTLANNGFRTVCERFTWSKVVDNFNGYFGGLFVK